MSYNYDILLGDNFRKPLSTHESAGVHDFPREFSFYIWGYIKWV